jgi:tetratricopeptide (TPR) repeat protein
MMTGSRASIGVVLLSAALAGACSPRDGVRTDAAATTASGLQPPPGLGLRPIALPDFSKMEAPAREQMEARFSLLKSRIADRSTPRSELGTAYGEMGKLLMAATYLDAAESCYLNAEALAPQDRRWPYYLGHIYKVKGPLSNAAASFERALKLQPQDVATLVWLGEAYLSEGRADAAAPLFAKALAAEPQSAAAHFGAGREALATRDYSRAVTHLKTALDLDPRATATNYPLAMAYRGLGNIKLAETHLAQQGDIEARPADPLMQELDALLQSPEAYNVRGGRELEAGNWAAAAETFRKGLAISPGDPSLRHRLGTALSQMGDVQGAIEQFEQVIRTTPSFARAHFSLGVLMNDAGRYDEAMERFAAALKYEPGYIPTRVQMARAMAHSGHEKEALDQYQQALKADPTMSDAAFGYAMTLVRLHRYQEAHDRLAEAAKTYADQPNFANALARLLAAAPDDRVRDGRQAKVLVDALLKGEQTIALAETTAMMLAELGDYRQAARVQRDVIEAAEQAGLRELHSRLTATLALYEHGQPCRTPFREDEFP